MDTLTNNDKIIAYHGTSKENYTKILDSKYFKKRTYFALDISDAKFYGGKHIFRVIFDKKGFKGEGNWQFHLRENISFSDLEVQEVK